MSAEIYIIYHEDRYQVYSHYQHQQNVQEISSVVELLVTPVLPEKEDLQCYDCHRGCRRCCRNACGLNHSCKEMTKNGCKNQSCNIGLPAVVPLYEVSVYLHRKQI